MPIDADQKLDPTGHRQPLRERFAKPGRSALADYELLRLLLAYRMHKWFDQIAGLTTFPQRLILTITQVFQDSRFVLHATGKFRRFWLVHFRKEYVQGQLLVRGGVCRQCGACCNLVFTCPMLTRKGLCLVYGTCRPQACKVFPIDQRDIDEVKLCGRLCGYCFNRKDSDIVRKIGRS